jgi:hypothetical protein
MSGTAEKVNPDLAVGLAYLTKHPDRFLFPLVVKDKKLRPKGQPAIKNNLELASNSPTQLRQWYAEHIRRPDVKRVIWGLSLKKSGLVAIDVDCGEGKVGAASFSALMKERLGVDPQRSPFPPTEVIFSPSATDERRSRHIIYKGEHHFSASTKLGKDIDTPNYIVIAGTTFDDGRAYTLVRDVPVALLPEWIAEKIKPHHAERQRNYTGDAIPFDVYKRMLDATPYAGGPDGLDDRHDYMGWLTFAMECHEAASGDEGDYLNAFIEWSLNDPHPQGKHGPWTTDQIISHWQSFDADPPAGQTARTRASWFKLLVELGHPEFIGEANTAEMEFAKDEEEEPPETDTEMAARLKRTAERRKRREQEAAPETLESLLAGWCYIGQQRRWVRKRDGMLWESTAFNDYFADVSVPDKRDTTLIGRHLLSRPRGHAHAAQKFDTFCYLPGKPENVGGAYNQYVPSAILPAAGDTALWDQHLAYLFPVKAIRDMVLDWLAWVLQHLDKKPKHALFIRGEIQGTGKSFIGDVFAELIGEANRSPVDQGDFETPHNGWQMKVKLITCEEIRSLAPAAMRKLHGWITQGRLKINEKNMPQVTIPDVIAYMFFSNKLDALPVDDSDRRYLVVATDAKPKDKAYYCRLYDLLDNPAAIAAIKHQLLTRNLGDYTAAGAAPYTDAKGAMIEESASDLQSFMVSQQATPPFCYSLVTLNEVVDAIPREYRPRTGKLLSPVKDVLRRRYDGINLSSVGPIQTGATKRDMNRVWAIGPNAVAIAERPWSELSALYQTEHKHEAKAADAQGEEDFGA